MSVFPSLPNLEMNI
nr:unnamed protein product [Callosobruchus analis]